MNVSDLFGYSLLFLYSLAALLVSFYIFVHYAHVKERDFVFASIYRAFIVVGIAIPPVTLFMIPIDKLCTLESSGQNFGFEFNLELPLKIVMFFLVSCFFVNIFARVFYNQSLEMKRRSRFGRASLAFVGSLAIYFAFVGLTMLAYNNPIKYKTTFVISPFMFFGVLVFCGLASVGLSALPLNVIRSYLAKPARSSAEELVMGKQVLLEENLRIIKEARACFDLSVQIQIAKQQKQKDVTMMEKVFNEKQNDLRVQYTLFEEFVEENNELLVKEERNMIIDVTSFCLGISGAILSLAIILHVIIGIAVKIFILDIVLVKLPLIVSIVLFMVIALYLLICIVNGIGKVSNFFLKHMESYQFRLNKTWSDTFLIGLNVIFVALLGMICFFVRFFPEFMNQTLWGDLVKIIQRDVKVVKVFYQYNIFEIGFVFLFFTSFFLGFRSDSNEVKIKNKIQRKILLLERNKQRVEKLKLGRV